eukprot:CCRYP_000774-RA/>CCRYP_000774-RA protein AED:0.57 eAED:0.42 QI:0/0/0/0.5/1/1/2/0/79
MLVFHSDLLPDSVYYQILKARNEDLYFLMPQFYNGLTCPDKHGVDGGAMSAAGMFADMANGIFQEQPDKFMSLSLCDND